MWAREVMSSYSFVKEVSSIDARRWFLQILRCLRCEKCVNSIVITDENFPVEIENSPVTLKTTCFGLHFFVPDPREDVRMENLLSLVLNIDYCHLVACDLKDAACIRIAAVIRGRIWEFEFRTNVANAIKRVIDNYSTEADRENVLRNFEEMGSHSINIEPQNTISNVDTIGTPHGWSPQRRVGVWIFVPSSSGPTWSRRETVLPSQLNM